jgi:site-specific DNA-methyltransferase (adenine-specific)
VDKIEFDEAINPQAINQDYKRILSDIHKVKSYEDFTLWSNELTEHKNKHSITTGKIKKDYSRSYCTFKTHQKGAGLRSIIPLQTEHYDFQHPTQKPVKLFKQLVELTTKEGDLIVDPFAGSFTTSLACLELNRKYICIEKDKEYYEVGKNRIAKWHEENNQKDLFSCN